ncbi:RtcB family protein [Bacteroides sp. UBA939]|uniref:RtcB family protein n=1 Tax=Bacteroides sp. UBA939 TaxID=1946092 RepID=UPI0025BD4DE0|nr:RtcB family protein [Bacteroides sp. UBA939]
MIELKGKYNKDCKIFIDDVETEAIELVQSILNQEVSEGVPVRIMPDTHVGKGIVIGFTMPLTTMVNPNYIGVDIGCSVTTHKLNKRIEADQLPTLDHAIRRSVPMGMNIRREKNYDNWWVESYFEEVNRNIALFRQEWTKRFGEWTKRSGKENVPACADRDYAEKEYADKDYVVKECADEDYADKTPVDKAYIAALCKKIGMKEDVFYYSIGTLGGGNHFIEVGESANDGAHYLTIHSGSRNFGLKVCNYHAKKMLAQRGLTQEYFNEFKQIIKNTLPTSDIPQKLEELAVRYKVDKKEYLLEGNDMYAYLLDMVIAQTYAQFNHKAMSKAIFKDLGADYHAVDSVYSMHNFIDTTDWIIRKGAIRSYSGEKMVIPFNMRDGILICEGKSNPDWNYSAPHGAGRVLARNKALSTLDMEEFSKEMEGIYSTSVCRSTLDESPMAYKDKNIIMEAIKDTATVIDAIRPVMNIKAK